MMVACAATLPLHAADVVAPASPIVKACVDENGKLVSAEIFQSSNYPDIDAAALKIARATKFSPAKDAANKNRKLSCVKFKVKFVIRDGEPVPDEV